ncbi:hypothetical protein CONCODRAFT_71082 [Conidiobolus coronatus NRRL 28638]|uniref:GLTSCR protein conserved domain-containing protein n=1 Tax=Conidiobolus coronatus (strain ATCC 28846 / CBS 209.66 / NRRL 28638) TaxID=796925 RepID=A0A137P4L6_CONC2|nr:hypothetical protein CONCODRAFT_71082 [Conidiobolus coronatus NRRL 28638]|eukprot:KXN69970.1 hypothetical protein CONCODRAFT_71082 [Conidiobolus coronatus NRRL 28638]
MPQPASETSATSYSKEPNAPPHAQTQASRAGVNMIKIPHLTPSANTSLFPYGTLSTNNQPTSYLKDSQEIERNRELKVRLQKTLEIEQQTISHPTYLVPFSSKRDAIERLLPYHLYQYPDLPNPHRSNLQLISTSSNIEEMLPRVQNRLNNIVNDEYYKSSLDPQSHDVQLNRLLNSTRQQ